MIINGDMVSNIIISGIYCIENIIDGKKYIGYSENIYKRWKFHIMNLNGNYHKNAYLNHAWNKYGEENFKFWVIEEYINDPQLLKLMETYFIVYYESFIDFGKGYNLTLGGEGLFNISNLTRKKMSKKGINNPNYGRKVSLEVRKKMSNTHKLLTFSENHRKNLSISVTKYLNENREKYIGENNPFYGKQHSDEQKQKWSEMRKGKRNGGEKLSVENVIEIKKMLMNGIMGCEIAKIFNTSKSNISSIKNGLTWGDIIL